MRGEPKIIAHLNKALKNELTTINQYFLHSRMLRSWGVHTLSKKEYEESIDEMKHADWLIERILFLEGLPNLQDLGKLYIGENVQEIIECDLRQEVDAIGVLRNAIADAEQVGDYGSRDLLQKILSSEEEHIDWLETQLDLIARIGLERYTQSQVGEPSGVLNG